jgi:hypothetical protein
MTPEDGKKENVRERRGRGRRKAVGRADFILARTEVSGCGVHGVIA